MSRTNTGSRSSRSTPIPKTALTGAPGGTAPQTGANNGTGQTLNRTTRRAIQRAMAAAQSGNAAQAAQILESIGRTQTAPTPTGGTAGGGRTQPTSTPNRQNQNQNQSRNQSRAALFTPSSQPLSIEAITSMFRSLSGSEALRAENVGTLALAIGLRDEDMMTLTSRDAFTLCRNATTIGLAFTALTRPPAAGQQNQSQTQTQSQQNRSSTGAAANTSTGATAAGSGKRRNRNRNRNRNAVAV